jgi:hypothetical protein
MGLKKLFDDLKRVATGKVAVDPGPDGFPIDPASPLFRAHSLLNEFLAEVPDFTEHYQIKPAAYPSGLGILEAPAEERIALIEAMTERRAWVHKKHRHSFSTSFGILQKLTNQLFRRELPYTSAQAASLVSMLSKQMPSTHWFDDDLIPILKICEQLKAQRSLSSELKEALLRLKSAMKPGSRWESAARNRFRDTIVRLTARRQPELIEAGEAWSNAALEDLKAMTEEKREAWLSLLEHCHQATPSKPPQKWSRAAMELIEPLGDAEFKTRVARWFELVRLPRPVHCEPRSRWQPNPDLLLTERNSTILKGLAWCCAGRADAEISQALSNLAEACFKKVPMLGPRCPRVGNACLYSLGTTSSEDAAAQLSRLNSTVKQPTAKKRIGKSLDTAATLTGQTREDLEEKSVPTFGFGLDGKLTRTFGDSAAELRIVSSRDVEVSWSRNGKELKTAPVEIKRDHAEAFKQFQKLAKDITKMLAAQRIRIERLLVTERDWDLESWRQRYLDQPLLAGLSRRLIWHFTFGERKSLGAWLDGRIVDVQDKPLDWLAPEARVRLWHPIGFPVETVAAWREWVQTHEFCQPFKQAHREVYILTDAELRTHSYSNRFAAHILGQHQFAALCTQRGWKYALMGGFDSHTVPTLELPAWDISAEFWVEGVGELAASGIALHLTTDQVRFVRAGDPVPLTEVPAPVFTEVMRDVDLFVGVASVGNDPAWSDGGPDGRYRDYWQSYSFGTLNATAQTRREVLQRLVPRLKIAGQCSLADKFLVVKGSLRTYKIHLGSGNILMEPNDQYLCIVPDRGGAAANAGEKVLLPFEGDSTLSIILSKAFLLAEDQKIKDQTILPQIKSR